MHQEDHMFLPDIPTLSSGAPEESSESETSLAEKDSKSEIFFSFIATNFLQIYKCNITWTLSLFSFRCACNVVIHHRHNIGI